MSNTLIESPVAASQLYFSWCNAMDSAIDPASGECIECLQKPMETLRKASNQAGTANDKNFDSLGFSSDRRVGRPVRIGPVMIKLLKRYGITDQEIEEGLAGYARKNQRSLAS